jgi:hypothetical protein
MIKHRHTILRIALSIILAFAFTLTAYAATLTYWYSDLNTIGKWSSSPQVWYSKLNSNSSFAFLSGLLNGESIWNSALGTSIDVSSSYTSAPIKYYGGTKAQIDALSIFPNVPTNQLGNTEYTEYEFGGYHTYNGSTKTWYTHTENWGYVVDRTDMNYNNYIKTSSHELGHAMGWEGHSTNSTWVMTQGKLENTILATGEKNHLDQIY